MHVEIHTICCEVTFMLRVGVEDTIRFPPDDCDADDIPIDRCNNDNFMKFIN